MTKHLLLGLLLLLLGTTALHASSGAAAFQQANRHFASGEFAPAAATYEEIISKHGNSAAALYNLGNSYQKLGKYGPAILAYERARLITPRDPDLIANLALARKAATAFVDPERDPRLEAVLTHLSRNEWSWIVAGSALFLGALSVLCGLTRLPRRWMLRTARISSSTAAIIIAAGAAVLYLRHGEADLGIVLSENATVRLSPFDQAEALGTPGPGRIVRLHDGIDGFRYIQVPGTQLQGWIADNDVAAIIPTAPRR